MIELHRGDCLEVMQGIPDTSVDLVLTDLPYQVTACRWDIRVPLEPLWAHYKRIIKPNGAVVLTATQPFTSMLVMSNREWFRYELIWSKGRATGHLDARRRPMKSHESILIFSANKIVYNPQFHVKEYRNIKHKTWRSRTDCYNNFDLTADRTISAYLGYPHSIICIPAVKGQERGLHPTQKPVALMEYLIRTYSNEGETVLDSCMGSGTTLVACLNTNRHGIGIEKDPEIFATAEKRIAAELNKTPLLTGS
jgi:site-specific DNA-methyltransferase (adenine-specific)